MTAGSFKNVIISSGLPNRQLPETNRCVPPVTGRVCGPAPIVPVFDLTYFTDSWVNQLLGEGIPRGKCFPGR